MDKREKALDELLRDIITDLNVRASWANYFHPEPSVRKHYSDQEGNPEIPISRGLLDRAGKLLYDTSQTQDDHGIPK